MKVTGARVIVTKIDPICALQVLMEGLPILTLEDVVSTIDIFVATIGNKGIIMVDQMRKINNAIVCNIGHFDNDIDMQGLKHSHVLRRLSSSLRLIELWNEKKSGKYEKKVYVLPKHLDEKVEKVAAMHLPKLGANLTKLSPYQAEYINVLFHRLYKLAHS